MAAAAVKWWQTFGTSLSECQEVVAPTVGTWTCSRKKLKETSGDSSCGVWDLQVREGELWVIMEGG